MWLSLVYDSILLATLWFGAKSYVHLHKLLANERYATSLQRLECQNLNALNVLKNKVAVLENQSEALKAANSQLVAENARIMAILDKFTSTLLKEV